MKIRKEMEKFINKTGLCPIEFKVVVELDEVSEKRGELFVPLSVRDKEQMMQVKATLIAHGGDAFIEMNEPKPVVGDRVYVAKAAGYAVQGKDGKEYRLMNDNDIAAIIMED
jgi:co-chaperonin GroES (HSP10)